MPGKWGGARRARPPPRSANVLSCQICLEDFEETGDFVPRILPCSHTLCEKCMKVLIGHSPKGDRLECPECRKKHAVVDNVRTFPQNKYLLATIHRKMSVETTKGIVEEKVAKCEVHGKELILYCKQIGCGKVICQKCLTKFHCEHDVIDIEEKERLTLFCKVTSLTEKLESRKQTILLAEADIINLHTTCIRELEMQQEKILRMVGAKFHALKEKVTEQSGKNKAEIDEDVRCHDRYLEILENIKKNSSSNTAGRDDVVDAMDTVDSIEKSFEFIFRDKSFYKVFEYDPSQTDTEQQMEMLFPKLNCSQRLVDFGKSSSIAIQKKPKQTMHSQPTYTGTKAASKREVADPPLSPILFFIFMRFSANIMPNNRLVPPEVGAPPPGKSWIRH